MEKTDLSGGMWGGGSVCMWSPPPLCKWELATTCYWLWSAFLPLTEYITQMESGLRLAKGLPWMSPRLKKTAEEEANHQEHCFPRGLLPLNWKIIMFPGCQGRYKAHLFTEAFVWCCGRLSQCNCRHEAFGGCLLFKQLCPIDTHKFKIQSPIMPIYPLNLEAGKHTEDVTSCSGGCTVEPHSPSPQVWVPLS